MPRRILHLALAILILVGSVNLYAAAECYGAQQCNFYDDVERRYASGYGWYCGWYGIGCTECVDMDCNSCVTNGPNNCAVNVH